MTATSLKPCAASGGVGSSAPFLPLLFKLASTELNRVAVSVVCGGLAAISSVFGKSAAGGFRAVRPGAESMPFCLSESSIWLTKLFACGSLLAVLGFESLLPKGHSDARIPLDSSSFFFCAWLRLANRSRALGSIFSSFFGLLEEEK